MIRLFLGQLAGVFLILSVAAWFIFNSVPSAQAGQTCGLASYYGTESGTRTATGERFTGRDLTAAMPSRSHLGERWRVHYRGKSVIVRINDLGPAKRLHRVIDLSKAAASRIGLVSAGVGRVCLERVR